MKRLVFCYEWSKIRQLKISLKIAIVEKQICISFHKTQNFHGHCKPLDDATISINFYWLSQLMTASHIQWIQVSAPSKGLHAVTPYCKVARSRLSWLVAHPRVFRRLMKGKLDALAKKFQNWIVDWSTAHDFKLNQNWSTKEKKNILSAIERSYS